MTDIFIVINFALAAIAFWVNYRRAQRDNVRRGLRWAGMFIAFYIGFVYAAVMVGLIPEPEARLWLRFFQGVILAYMVAEALHG